MAFSTDVSINNCQGDLHVHDVVCIIVTHCDDTTWLVHLRIDKRDGLFLFVFWSED